MTLAISNSVDTLVSYFDSIGGCAVNAAGRSFMRAFWLAPAGYTLLRSSIGLALATRRYR